MKAYNLVLEQKEARAKVKAGIDLAVDLVSKTLGAKSRRILIDTEYGDITACDDGTTILNKINPEDTQLGLGVKIVREASAKTNTDEGDGTTSTAVILGSLVDDLLQAEKDEELLIRKDAGSNLKLRHEIQGGLKKVLDFIDANKIEVADKEQLAHVGRVSANDDEVGNQLAEMFTELGKDGAVSISEGNATTTEYEIVKGMSFDQGWIAQQFITNPKREEATLENSEKGHVNVLVAASKLQDIQQMEKLIGLFQNGLNDLLIIADDVTGIPLSTLIVNKMRQMLRTVVVKAPQLGTMRDTLQDICAVTGATLIGGDDGLKFEDLTLEHIGRAKRVVVTKGKTIIVGVDETKKEIDARVATLEERMSKESSDYEKKKLQERISKLRGGVGSIKVGGLTPLEIKDKRDKITDAVAAVRSALRGGIVDGGGVTLLLASAILDPEIKGETLLANAIKRPYEQIMENSDMDKHEMMQKTLKTGHGYNVETEKFGDMIKMGVIDPANVVKASVQNAVSSANMVANIGGALALVRDEEEKEGQER